MESLPPLGVPELAVPYVAHGDIVRFAERAVNARREDLEKYNAQVKYLHDQLAAYISKNLDYDLHKILNAGSVAKGTALKTISDMDIAAYVRKARAPADERLLLEWLVARLREVYPTMSPDHFQVQSHSVRISYRGTGLDLDVAPVLYEGDPRDRGYLVEPETGGFVLTSIPMHLEFIRKRKDRNPHFAQVVRLLKWWVRERRQVEADFRFKSFLVELLVAHLMDRGENLSDYPLALERVFSHIIRSQLLERIAFSDYYSQAMLPPNRRTGMEFFDPVNPENNVASGYSDADRRRIIAAAQDALDALNEAHHATTKSRAVGLWQIVLGPSFDG